MIAAALALTPASHAGALDLPDLDRAIRYRPRQPLRVLTADGVEFATFGTERRRFVAIEQIPRRLKDAVIAVEDARFREHAGVDAKGIARAVAAMATGGMRQGGSTITQQVARTMFLSNAPTAERKAQEIRIALELESRLSKDKILELYMNEIWLGHRAYGFAEASRLYFGKAMDKLSLAEAAMLAGLPQNPQYANPIADLDRAVKRQRHVLDRMRTVGLIDTAQWAAARAEKLVIAPPQRDAVYAGHVAEMARLAVVERVGIDAATTAGITVTTSLRASDQRAAWAALRRGVLAHDRKGAWRGPEGAVMLPAGADDAAEGIEGADSTLAKPSKDPLKDALKGHRDDPMLRAAVVLSASAKEIRARLADGERIAIAGDGLTWVQSALAARAKAPQRIERGSVIRVVRAADGKSWRVAQWPQAEGAFVAVDPRTGRVRALVGAFDFGRQPFNHVTQGSRQPGSAIKPLAYSAALEHGVMPDTVVDDAPFSAPDGWSPANSDGRFLGPITIREALAQSRNAVSVRVLQHVGVPAAREWLARFGLDPARQPDNLTLALGSGSITPLQLARAYAVFANGGMRVEPVVIERITDARGAVLFEAPKPAPLSEAQRAIPARNAWLTSSLLGEVTRTGTAARARVQLKRADLFGKTGTTNDAVDAWFAGFQPGVVAVAWMGYGTPRSLGSAESGADLALPIWIDYMSSALKGVPASTPKPPEGLVRQGEDWVYDELAVKGHVTSIDADGRAQVATPFAPWSPEPAAPR